MADDNSNLNEERSLRSEINQLIQQYLELLRQAGITQDGLNAREQEYKDRLDAAGDSQQRLADLQGDLNREVSATSELVKNLDSEFDAVAGQLDSIVGDLGNAGDLGRRILGSFKSLRNVTDKIRDDRDLTRVLSIKQLEIERENLAVQQSRLDREIERGVATLANSGAIRTLEQESNNLAQQALDARQAGNEEEANRLEIQAENVDLAKSALTSLKDKKEISQEQLDALRENQDLLNGLNDTEKERVIEALRFNKVLGKSKAQYDAINDKIESAIQREKALNKNMGLTSSIVEGLGKLPGLNRVFKVEDIEEVKKAAREALVEQQSLMNEAALLEKKAQIAKEAGNDKLAEELTLQAANNRTMADGIKLAGKRSIASALFQKSLSNLKDTLTDPAAILALIGKTLLNNSQLTNQFQQELGTSYGNALAMRNELNNAAAASGDLFINSEKLQKSFFALAENTGVFFDLSSQSAETFTNLTDRIGLAGQEAGNLTTLLRLQGKDTETTMSNLVGTANAALATSKTTASVKQILGDIASSSKGLQASFAANPGALAKAAVAARELGTTLKDIEGTQKSLLDFESSIGAELEAELLTGKQLNLEKARAAALNNDLETVSKELANQGLDLASFSEMNVIQQEKMAAAMGMNRDAMADMLLKQQTQNMTADEVRKRFGEQTYEQFKALSAQDKFNAGVAKLKDLFGSVMTALTPIIDLVAMLIQPIAFVAKLLGKLNELTGGFSNALIGVAIAAKALGVRFGAMFNPKTYAGFFNGLMSRIKGISFSGLGDQIKGAFAPGSTDGLFKGIKDKVKGLSEPLKGLKDKVLGAFSGNKGAGIEFDPRMAGGGRFRDMASGRMVSEEAANAAGVFKPGTGPTAAAAAGATDAAGATGATPAPADDGKALKKKMQNIAEGIKAFADKDVIKGALSMIVAAPGLIALGVASLPLKITEKINGKAIQASMKGIAKGIAAFANPQVALGGLALIPISLALATMAVGAIGLGAIALLGAPAAAGMFALTAGLTALGTAAATGVPFLGVALVGAFGAALIPFGIALAAAAPAIEAVGTVIATTISAIADAVVTVMPALTQSLIDLSNNINLGGLFGLAMALPALAMGLGSIALMSPLIALSSLSLLGLGLALTPLTAGAEGLVTTADALTKVAEAIQNIDVSKIAALSIAVAGLTLSLAGLMALGPLALGAIAVVGGAAAIGGAAAGGAPPISGVATGGTSPVGGDTQSPMGGTSIAAAEAGGITGEEVKSIVEETVTATINSLVPEMVAALKEGQGKIKVTNDNFNNSRQSEGPSRNRNIVNNNFA